MSLIILDFLRKFSTPLIGVLSATFLFLYAYFKGKGREKSKINQQDIEKLRKTIEGITKHVEESKKIQQKIEKTFSLPNNPDRDSELSRLLSEDPYKSLDAKKTGDKINNRKK